MKPANDTRRVRPGVFTRYVLLGVGSLLLNLAIVTLLSEMLRLSPALAGGIGYAVIFALNFTLARRYVFESTGAIIPEAARFSIAQFASRLGEYGTFLALTYAAGVHYFTAVVVVGALFFAIKFVVYRLLVFRTGEARAP